jgi:hypothetical protein
MEEVLNQVELNIDKTEWVPVKFGDVVFEPKETCKDISQINHGGDCKAALCSCKRLFSCSYMQ